MTSNQLSEEDQELWNEIKESIDCELTAELFTEIKEYGFEKAENFSDAFYGEYETGGEFVESIIESWQYYEGGKKWDVYPDYVKEEYIDRKTNKVDYQTIWERELRFDFICINKSLYLSNNF